MPNYKFTEQAENDLDAIVEYTLENWGQSQALKYVHGLEALLVNLALTPSLGVNQDGIFKDLLSFPYVSHVVYYYITAIYTCHERSQTEWEITR